MSSIRDLRLILAALAAVLLGGVASAHTQGASSDLSGTWKWSQEGPGGTIEFVLKVKQDSDKLTGSLTGFDGNESPIEDGRIQDGAMVFKVTREFGGRPFVTTYTLKPNGAVLKGRSETVFAQEFEAKREQ